MEQLYPLILPKGWNSWLEWFLHSSESPVHSECDQRSRMAANELYKLKETRNVLREACQRLVFHLQSERYSAEALESDLEFARKAILAGAKC